jgi:transcriptional regulator with XRE-family HTH domain
MGSTSREQLYDAFGTYVRSQRRLARLTLRQAAELASISNPYLSQIEHGVALPSISVISSLAEALSVSAETMLLRAAGIVSPCTVQGRSHSEDAIRQDPRLDERQKLALLAVLGSFVGSSQGSSQGSSDVDGADEPTRTDTSGPAPSKVSPSRVSRSRISPSKIASRPATAEAVSTRRKRT